QFYFYHCYSYILKYFQLLLLLQIFLIQLVLVLLFFLTFYFQSIRSMLFDLTSIHSLITVYIVAIESLVSSVHISYIIFITVFYFSFYSLCAALSSVNVNVFNILLDSSSSNSLQRSKYLWSLLTSDFISDISYCASVRFSLLLISLLFKYIYYIFFSNIFYSYILILSLLF